MLNSPTSIFSPATGVAEFQIRLLRYLAFENRDSLANQTYFSVWRQVSAIFASAPIFQQTMIFAQHWRLVIAPVDGVW